jgi:hypothetical protein
MPPQFFSKITDEELRGLLTSWFEHHRALHLRPYTPASLEQLAKWLEEIGVGRAVAALKHSLASNYQGIYEPPASARGAPAQRETFADKLRRAKEKMQCRNNRVSSRSP